MRQRDEEEEVEEEGLCKVITSWHLMGSGAGGGGAALRDRAMEKKAARATIHSSGERMAQR